MSARQQGKAAEWKAHAKAIRGKSDEELLADIVAGQLGGFRLPDAAAAELQRRTTVRAIESVDRFSRESHTHSRSMFWLTVTIAVLTAVLLFQGFGCFPVRESTSPTSADSGERAHDVEGVWDEHAGRH